jgi:hypothetical protein
MQGNVLSSSVVELDELYLEITYTSHKKKDIIQPADVNNKYTQNGTTSPSPLGLKFIRDKSN